MATYEFAVYDSNHDIMWTLSMDFWQEYKKIRPDDTPFTTMFWNLFEIWVQQQYKVINKPFHDKVFAFSNKEDQVEFLLKCL